MALSLDDIIENAITQTNDLEKTCETVPRKNETAYLSTDDYNAVVKELGTGATTVDDVVDGLNSTTHAGQLCNTNDVLVKLLGTNACGQTVGSFVYDPSHCDPGYWCGCSSQCFEQGLPCHEEECKASNITDGIDRTYWMGHYTPKEVISNVTDVAINGSLKDPFYVGALAAVPDTFANFVKCPSTFYCPGSTNTSECPGLCPGGFYCPNSTVKLLCPEGYHCLPGSIEPKKCEGLQRCNEEGMKFASATWGLTASLLIAIFLFACLVVTYRFLNKIWPFRGEENKAEPDDDVDVEEEQKEGRRVLKEARKQGSMRPSILTVPKTKFKIDAAFENLQLTLPNGICIMQGVTGELKAGQFTAIMGPSGAGKSTFLSLLSGKVEPTGGTLLVNGEEASLKDFRKLVGFVPQEDIMLRELTVEENIRHSAFMRLPSELTTKEKDERVYQVMESLDLVSIRNSVIGNELKRGISGGQRKRVNVAMELVADPSLLALDEPTSGLDSTTSSNLCDTLKQLADSGVNVAAVIHQPKMEILNMFTNVLLLGVGGRTCYMGPAKDMTAYFTKIGFPLPPYENPADYYMDVIAGMVPIEDVNHLDFKKEDLFDLWEKAPANPGAKPEGKHEEQGDANPRSSIKKKAGAGDYLNFLKCSNNDVQVHRQTAGQIEQTYLLFRRALLQRCRVPRNTLIPMILAIATGALIAQFYRKAQYVGIPIAVTKDPFSAVAMYGKGLPTDPTGNMWMFTALCVMLVSIKSLESFGRERAVCLRESFSGTYTVSYWMAKTCESAIWMPIHAGLFVSFALRFGPLPIHLFDFFFVIYGTLFGYYGVGHCVSLMVEPSNRGLVLLISILVLVIAFSGTLVPAVGWREHIWQLFFPLWNGQSFFKALTKDYEESYDVPLLNDKISQYNLSFPFSFDILCAFLTGFIWHLFSLLILWRQSLK